MILKGFLQGLQRPPGRFLAALDIDNILSLSVLGKLLADRQGCTLSIRVHYKRLAAMDPQ